MPRRSLACFLLCLVPTALAAFGQDTAPPSIPLSAYTDTLDLALPQPFQLRPFILPGSVLVTQNGMLLDTTRYRVDLRHGHITFRPRPRADATVIVAYQTWQPPLQDVYRRRRVAEVDSTGNRLFVEERPTEASAFDPLGGVRLQRSGSISRGIIAGNNRDVTVESGLRMNLAGEIARGVTVQAVLTDANTPIQPEGTTQRIDDFDRVYIELAAPVGTARLGDINLAFQESVFAQFNRKLQGASITTLLPGEAFATGSRGGVTAAGAVSRGLYRTQEITPLEGVQGPYRLQGANGEPFILVLAGTEVVYLDGVRLTRGETNDYVIDYGTGELSFTPNRLITAERRITVEFQYTTNQFTRTLLGSQVETAWLPDAEGLPRLRLGATVLREADSPSFNEELGLSSADSLLLVDAGDGLAARSGAEPVIFDPDAPFVQYRAEERLDEDDRPITVYIPLDSTPEEGTTVFRVRFTRLGPGRGSYTRDRPGQQVNGIAYTYVGPGLGEYEPIRQLPAPRRRQVFDVRGAASVIPGVDLFGEWARSTVDLNRLSDLGDADNEGFAYLGGVRLPELGLGFGRLSVEAQRRVVNARFASFDRIRSVEFARRWNLADRGIGSDGTEAQGFGEIVDEANAALQFAQASAVSVEIGQIDRDSLFEGSRVGSTLSLEEVGLPRIDYQIESIESRDARTATRGRWLRHKGLLRQPLFAGRLEPRVSFEHERRRQRLLTLDGEEIDSLITTSLAFLEVRPGIAWITNRLEATLEVSLRQEDEPLDGILQEAANAWTTQAGLSYQSGRALRSEARFGYRIKRFTDEFQGSQGREDGESVVIRWNGDYQPGQRAVQLSWFYDALTERTPTLQEVYYRAGPEFGEFVWEDDGDGIAEVDEFVRERLPNEGNYLLTYIPSDSLSSVISVQARLRLTLDPSRIWRTEETTWKRRLAQVRSQTTIDVLEKSETPDLADVYLLQLGTFRDPVLTQNGRLRLRQDLSLFRSEPRYGLDGSYNRLESLQRLASGREAQTRHQWRLEGNVRPALRWTLRLAGAFENDRVTSEEFASRRYDVASRSVEPQVSYTPSQSAQGTLLFAWTYKEDASRALTARILRLPLQLRYARAGRLSLTGRAEVARVSLSAEDADLRGQAAFTLTEGRGPGTSYLWSVVGQATLNQYLRATLQYDGRAPADAPTLHTLRLQLSAVF